jgi:hypothetical protein
MALVRETTPAGCARDFDAPRVEEYRKSAIALD